MEVTDGKKMPFFNFLLALMLLSECTSPLSDIGLTDPSLIRMNIELGKKRSSSSIEAVIYDKNSNFVELRDGSIAINGIPMEVNY